MTDLLATYKQKNQRLETELEEMTMPVVQGNPSIYCGLNPFSNHKIMKSVRFPKLYDPE